MSRRQHAPTRIEVADLVRPAVTPGECLKKTYRARRGTCRAASVE
ncbi:hypothetical protein AKJ09_11010 [Labilithrix luteola]|uniref:Uncharacterized protein n=1 Tax=Labilithrix luteola TaxID=1391654 RepID=A0A0K1QFC2_9BACT|nr:hypothetical protein AKJ09_11010 [Labilithrix luteola]